ncbi:MAG: hypothetical protein JW862_16085 [Anaerolineales bacterium]|nr:hypothetical protein [Anaerolineales bacterium]
MATLIAIPLLSVLVIFQSAVLGRIPLLQGVPDLVLLFITAWALQERVRSAWQWALLGGLLVGYLSYLPMAIPISSYLFATALALVFRRRIWRIPVLAMFVTVFVANLANHLASGLYLSITNAPIPILPAFNRIVLPSLILNLLLVIPVYALMKDLAQWLYPEEIEI